MKNYCGKFFPLILVFAVSHFIPCSKIHAQVTVPVFLDSLANRLVNLTTSNIRGYTPASSGQVIYLNAGSQSGLFFYDASDVTSPDDSAMIFVTTTGGYRWERQVMGKQMNILWWGVDSSGATDATYSTNKAVAFVQAHPNYPNTLYFPPGSYHYSNPIICAFFGGSTYNQVSVNFVGAAPSKDAPTTPMTYLQTSNSTLPLFIFQSAKGGGVYNMIISGTYTRANSYNIIQVDTLKAAQWDSTAWRDDPGSPYVAIAVDPFSDSTALSAYGYSTSNMYPGLHSYYQPGMGRGGSTGLEFSGLSISNFVGGIILEPLIQQNGELIAIRHCQAGFMKWFYAATQPQSKENRIEDLKVWNPVFSVIDGVNYGLSGGPGPDVDGVNIANAVNMVFMVSTSVLPFNASNVFAEGLFRGGINYNNGGHMINLHNWKIDWATSQPNQPTPDVYFIGNNFFFDNCKFLIYNDSIWGRMPLFGANMTMQGGSLNNPPIGIPVTTNNDYQGPICTNVSLYSPASVAQGNAVLGRLQSGIYQFGIYAGDPVSEGNVYEYYNLLGGIRQKLSYDKGGCERMYGIGSYTVTYSKSNFTGYFLSPVANALFNIVQPNDYILTGNLNYYDQFSTAQSPATVVGEVASIGVGPVYDTFYLRQVNNGIVSGNTYSLTDDWWVPNGSVFSGSVTSGSPIITNVKGALPGVGNRLDVNDFYPGTYVVSTTSNTVTMSENALTTVPVQMFMNGSPKVEVWSNYDPSQIPANSTDLQAIPSNTIWNVRQVTNHPYAFGSDIAMDQYKIVNPIFNGDTSVNKLRFAILSSIAQGNTVGISSTSGRNSYPSYAILHVNTDSLGNTGTPHPEMFDSVSKSYRTIAFLDDLSSSVSSGSYTPTFTNTTNISSSTLGQATYSKVGNIVSVNIGGTFTPTAAATATVLTVSLPYSTATTTQSYIGVGAFIPNSGGNAGISGLVNVNSGTTAVFQIQNGALTSPGSFSFSFQYHIN